MPGIKWIYLSKREGRKSGGFVRRVSHPKSQQETWGFEKGQKRDMLRKTQTWVRKEHHGSVSEASQPLQN